MPGSLFSKPCVYILLLLIAIPLACKTPSKSSKHKATAKKHTTKSTTTHNKPVKKTVVPENTDFYSVYSKKLGVTLKGTENKKLIQSMSSWMGVPYKYGGDNKAGCDCSGLVKSIFKEVYNKDLFRSAMDQMQNVRIIKRDELAIGDLVFFKTIGDKVSHVGIYIGENKFIHASSTRGVVINSLEEAYYKKCFYAGGRVAVN